MPTIQYSGNTNDPNSFSQRDMEHLIKTYNDTVNAIIFILNYTDRSNKPAFEKSLSERGIDNLDLIDQNPHNRLISALGMANDLHKRDGLSSVAPFSTLASLKLRNEISNYEEFYAELERRISALHWTFQTEMVFAFDKLYNDVKKFKSKYKNVVGLHKIFAELDTFLASTADIIGSPEVKWLNGSIPAPLAFALRDKLSANNTPIFPLHMYRDIMRFENAKEIVLDIKRERSRASHYDNIQRELELVSEKNIELSMANIDLVKQVQKLEQEKSALSAHNQELSDQIANMRHGILGKILFEWSQRRK